MMGHVTSPLGPGRPSDTFYSILGREIKYTAAQHVHLPRPSKASFSGLMLQFYFIGFLAETKLNPFLINKYK